jgi:hypothetical protein
MNLGRWTAEGGCPHMRHFYGSDFYMSYVYVSYLYVGYGGSKAK